MAMLGDKTKELRFNLYLEGYANKKFIYSALGEMYKIMKKEIKKCGKMGYANHPVYGNELEQLRQMLKANSKEDRKWDSLNGVYVPSHWRWNSLKGRYE